MVKLGFRLTQVVGSDARVQLPGDIDDFVGVRSVESASEGKILVFGPDEVGFGRVNGILGHLLWRRTEYDEKVCTKYDCG